MPPHPTDALTTLQETGTVAVQQDLGAVTLTVQRLDPRWARPVMTLLCMAMATASVLVSAEALFLLSAASPRALLQLLIGAAMTLAGAVLGLGFAFPMWGYRLRGFQLRLTQTALEIPGGLYVRRRTIPIDQIASVRAVYNHPLSQAGVTEGSGHILEVETRSGTEQIRIPLLEPYRDALLQAIRDHISAQRQRLAAEGHDLSQPSPPPLALTEMLRR